jgi:hypothetical protein
MKLFHCNYEKKTNLIFITSLIWLLNFRTTFKNIDYHMDANGYASVKFDPMIILIKNIICLLFIIVYIYENKISKIKFNVEKFETEKMIDDKSNLQLIYAKMETETSEISFNDISTHYQEINKGRNKILNYIKIMIIIIIIYISDEFYFLVANNHILDRIIINMRNFGILIFLLFLSPLVIGKSPYKYKHQLFPCLMILFIALIMILYNVLAIERFKKVHDYNLITFFGCFLLSGFEFSLIKYLLSIQFMSMYLIVFLKGVIGTIIFTIINLTINKDKFFDIIDKILSLEYEYMNEEFEIIQKIGYILTLIIIQYLKIFTINTFSQNHLLSSMMISDLIYFPLYIIERFVIQDFEISNIWSFILNFIVGVINVFLMLIFNEILECKFLGMNYNTVKNINTRQNNDYLDGQKDFNSGLKNGDFQINENDEVDDNESKNE